MLQVRLEYRYFGIPYETFGIQVTKKHVEYIFIEYRYISVTKIITDDHIRFPFDILTIFSYHPLKSNYSIVQI